MSSVPCRVAMAVAAMALVAPPAGALDPGKAITQYWRDTWGVRDGVPGYTIRDIDQTRDGYIWLATQGGLVRFDGVRFKVFAHSDFGEGQQGVIWSVAASRDGGLWVGVEGVGVYRHDHGVLTPYRFKAADPAVWSSTGPPGNVVVHEAPDGSLWMASYNWGVLRVRNGVVDFHAAVPLVEALLSDADGTVWVGTWGNGLARIRAGEVTYFGADQGLAGPHVRSLCRGRDGTLWVGSRDGLTAIKDGRFTVYTTAHGLSQNEVKALFEDRHGNLWIGTGDGGLCRFRDGVFSIRRRIQGLSDDKVTAVFEDDEGGLWLGLHGNLDRLRDTSVVMVTSAEGLPTDSVVQTLTARDGGLWVSTYGGGVSHLKDGRVTTYDARHGLPNLYVGALYEQEDGTLWMGLGSNELARLRHGRVKVFDTGKRYVKDIAEDEKGLLVALSRGGLYRLQNDKLDLYRTTGGDEIRHRYVSTIHKARDGALWVGSNEGLVVVREGRRSQVGVEQGLPAGGVFSLYEDADGILWIGTPAGLVRFKDGRGHVYPDPLGADAPAIASVLEDGSGHFWLNTNRGIARVAKSELHAYADGRRDPPAVRVFGNLDGLKVIEFRAAVAPRGSRTPDGRLWFSTVGGLAVIDPERLMIDRKVPPVLIDKVVLDGKERLARDGIEVPAGTENVEIHYTALSFTVPERATFRYRLHGFDRDWVDAGHKRVAYFTKLPPGPFHFEVRAANHEGVWNEAGASLRFTQRPQLHQTLWFRALLVLALGLAGLAAHRFRVRRLTADIEHRKHVELTLRRAQEHVTESLREKEVLLREIHHRVKNNFQIVISLLNLQSGSMKASPAQQVLRDSQDRVRSMALVHERLYNTAGLARIEVEPYVRSLVGGLVASHGAVAEKIHLRLHVDDVSLGMEAAVPCGLILNELVSNALKHAFPDGRGGEIAVELHKAEAGGFILRVSDDGVGFPPGLDHRQTDSLGLQLVTTLVTQLDGTIEKRPGPGTTFEVKFPEPRYKERM